MNIKTTEQIIRPIVRRTYGRNPMSEALIADLAERIDHWPRHSQRSREAGIMRRCWDFFPGGDTAAAVAEEIEAVLP